MQVQVCVGPFPQMPSSLHACSGFGWGVWHCRAHWRGNPSIWFHGSTVIPIRSLHFLGVTATFFVGPKHECNTMRSDMVVWSHCETVRGKLLFVKWIVHSIKLENSIEQRICNHCTNWYCSRIRECTQQTLTFRIQDRCHPTLCASEMGIG